MKQLRVVPFRRCQPLPWKLTFWSSAPESQGFAPPLNSLRQAACWFSPRKKSRDSTTQYAQGGIAAALSDEDEISLHLQDTLVAGDGLCNADAAKVLVEEAPRAHR